MSRASNARSRWLLAFTLAGIATVASLMRIAFFTGYFGSDEVTYVLSALSATNGMLTDEPYVGGIRLGINYPMAAAIMLFGTSQMAAALWGMICSVLEVMVVYWFGYRVWGRGAAISAALLLALLPLHVHLAGRIMADAPLGLFITLTFVCFYEAEERNSSALYMLAGTCAGFVFWIKEGTTIFVAVFLLWALIRQRVAPRWLWAVATMSAIIGANFALMWALSGDVLYLLRSIDNWRVNLVKSADNLAKAGDSTVLFYARYLFVDIWHTWLLGYLAAAGAVVSFFAARRDVPEGRSYSYLLVWSLGLLLLFSLFVVSLNPLRMIPKQTNYMTIFLAPLCLLGGIAIVRVKSHLARTLVLGLYALGALFLNALEQQTIHTFTANSRAALAYATEHPSSSIFVAENAYRFNIWAQAVSDIGRGPVSNLHRIIELVGATREGSTGTTPPSDRGEILAIVDSQTLEWGDNGLRSVHDIPTCWQKVETLQPPANATAGRVLISLAGRIAGFAPRAVAGPIQARVDSLLTPKPADVFRVPVGCS